MLSDFIDWGLLVGMLLVHELAHYIDAKRQGIYKGVFFNGIIAGVNLTEPFKRRWNYLGGIIYSMLLYPVAILLSSMGLAHSMWLWTYPIIAVILGAGDLFVIFGYNKNFKNMKFFVMRDTLWNRFFLKIWGIDHKEAGVIWVHRRR